jgi:ATP-dependent Clp protease ATP-binding subunit ClpA
MYRSISRLLRKKLVRLPQISPAPDSTVPSKDFSKVLAKANELRKSNGDSFMGVDVLLEALIENKVIQEALNEAGTAIEGQGLFIRGRCWLGGNKAHSLDT